MKKFLLLISLITISLTSCGVNYVKNQFFDSSFLKREGIPKLPRPEGKLLRSYTYLDEITREVYVNNEKKVTRDEYAQQVFGYIKSLSFKYFYTVTANDFLLTWNLDEEKEINSLDDCYLNNYGTYFFFYSNKDPYEENDIKYIKGTGINVGGSGTVSNRKVNFKFDYNIRICTSKSWEFVLGSSEETPTSSYEEN